MKNIKQSNRLALTILALTGITCTAFFLSTFAGITLAFYAFAGFCLTTFAWVALAIFALAGFHHIATFC